MKFSKTPKLLSVSAFVGSVASCVLPHATATFERDAGSAADMQVVQPEFDVPTLTPVDAPNGLDVVNPPVDVPNNRDIPSSITDIPSLPVDVPNPIVDVPNPPIDIPNPRPDVPNPRCGDRGEVCCSGPVVGVDFDGCRRGFDCWPPTGRCECGGVGQRPCAMAGCNMGAMIRNVNGQNWCVSSGGAGSEQNNCRGGDPECNAGLTCLNFGNNFCVATCGRQGQPCCLGQFCAVPGVCRAVATNIFGQCGL